MQRYVRGVEEQTFRKLYAVVKEVVAFQLTFLSSVLSSEGGRRVDCGEREPALLLPSKKRVGAPYTEKL